MFRSMQVMGFNYAIIEADICVDPFMKKSFGLLLLALGFITLESTILRSCCNEIFFSYGTSSTIKMSFYLLYIILLHNIFEFTEKMTAKLIKYKKNKFLP